LTAGLGNGAPTPFRRPSPRQLEPGAPGGRQGGALGQGSKPTLHRDFAPGQRDRRPHALRRRLLRPRRGREPD
jgi:hypothetical protein